MEGKPIKYRFWHRELKKMIPWEEIGLRIQHIPRCDDHEAEEHTHLEYMFQALESVGEFMEFTGKYDSKGREMYVGDIVQVDYITEFGVIPLRGKMVFNAKIAQYGSLSETDITIPGHIEEKKPPTIIGNIKENPELLTQNEQRKPKKSNRKK